MAEVENEMVLENDIIQINNDVKELPSILDGRWSKFVLFGSFLILTIIGLIIFSDNWLLQLYSGNPIYHAIILSLIMAVGCISAPLSSLLIKLFGFRVVTVVGSILAASFMLINILSNFLIPLVYMNIMIGIGIGFMYLSAITSIITYFDKYRPLAIGIALCGLNETVIFYKIVDIDFLFDRHITRIIFNCLVFSCTLLAIILRPFIIAPKKLNSNNNNNEKNIENTAQNTKNVKKKEITKRSKEWLADMILLFKNPVFLLFTFIWILLNSAQAMAYFYIILIIDKTSRNNSILPYYIIVVASLIGRLLFGCIYIKSTLIKYRYHIFSLAILICGIGYSCSSIVPLENVYFMIPCVIVIFMMSSGSIGMSSVIVADLFTVKKFTNAFSLLLFFRGITMLLEFNITYLFKSQQFEVPLIIFGVTIIACGLLSFIIPSLQRKQEKRGNGEYMERI